MIDQSTTQMAATLKKYWIQYKNKSTSHSARAELMFAFVVLSIKFAAYTKAFSSHDRFQRTDVFVAVLGIGW